MLCPVLSSPTMSLLGTPAHCTCIIKVIIIIIINNNSNNNTKDDIYSAIMVDCRCVLQTAGTNRLVVPSVIDCPPSVAELSR